MTLDLTKYCGDPVERPKISRPFSKDGYTWSTNGHFMIRVPLRDDVPENHDAPNVVRAWTSAVGNDASHKKVFASVTPFDLPSLGFMRCEECEGRGTIHNCPDCKCHCGECGGRGEIEEIKTVSVGAVLIQFRYARWLMELPNLSVSVPKTREAAVGFRFDGGDGLIMTYNGRIEEAVADLLKGPIA